MPAKQTPVLVKHCALAIYKSGYCTGTKVEKVQQAFDIAVSRLIEYKFLWKNAGKAAPEKIKLTSKGMKAEARHRREKDGKVKTDQWNILYKLIQEEIEEDAGAGATSQEAGDVAGESSSNTKQKRRRRVAKASRSAARRPKRVKRAKKARRR